jgi:hypothetical protein
VIPKGSDAPNRPAAIGDRWILEDATQTGFYEWVGTHEASREMDPYLQRALLSVVKESPHRLRLTPGQ